MYRAKGIRIFFLILGALLVIFVNFSLLTQRNVTSSELPIWAQSEQPAPRADDTNKSAVHFWLNNRWVRIPEFCKEFDRFTSALFSSSAGNLSIFFPDMKRDAVNARISKLEQMMHTPIVQEVMSQLQRHPGTGVIDLSSQFVLLPLIPAMFGNDVIIVNPLLENILSLKKTVEEKGLTSKVTFLFTTPSDRYERLTFRKPNASLCNAGTLDILRHDNNHPELQISTILLDDILPFIGFEKALILLDAHSRTQCIAEAIQLFHSLPVTAVLQEIPPNYEDANYADMENFLTFKKFSPEVYGPSNGQFKNPTYILWKRD